MELQKARAEVLNDQRKNIGANNYYQPQQINHLSSERTAIQRELFNRVSKDPASGG